MKRIIPTVFAVLLAGCSTAPQIKLMDQAKISEAKTITVISDRRPWVSEVEDRLRDAGFKVLRMPVQKTVQRSAADGSTEQYRQAASRYVLDIQARTSTAQECFGGGYDFDYIVAELIDLQENTTIMRVRQSGMSENCPPASGSIYQNIVNAVKDRWK